MIARWILLGMLLVGAGAALLIWSHETKVGASMVVVSDNLPAELYRVASSTRTLEALASNDVRITMFDWDSKRREFHVYRRHRADAQSPWSPLEKQVVSTSFDIADAVPLCNEDLDIRRAYVAGTYDNGTSTIERWDFVETTGGTGGFGGGSHPQITVNRTVIFQGTELDIIAAIAVDPNEESQLLVLTYATGKLMRLPLSGVSSPILVFDSTTVPELANARSIGCRQHVTLGPTYYLNSIPGWRRSMYKNEPHPDVIVAWDTNADHVPDSQEVLSWTQYKAQGHQDLRNFVDPCP